MRGHAPDEETVLLLRERLRAVDETVTMPPDLWERVRSGPPVVPVPRPAPGRRRAYGLPVRRRGGGPGAPAGRPPFRLPTGLVAAALVGLLVLGAWWLVRPLRDGARGHPAAPSAVTVAVTVYNAEAACRELRTLECSLGLARDPYGDYGSPGNRAGRVFHGDRLAALCVVIDGTLLRDESGITSRRWYRVAGGGAAGPDGGWLPGIRTRNTAEVRLCSAAEVTGAAGADRAAGPGGGRPGSPG
ncbi:hypothetical protein [Streptomyces zingiberis]|uniref:Serine/threonine protein kinase n=1 Tax=Streptomyces zingiberis TaxID=2053010 RepID=A0ABX1BVK1_9ACTN|nr:hypothetical protein [Streptomyces zingiberis]NJP99904.1 hypothetical protein [Streptomyces zingiberis]